MKKKNHLLFVALIVTYTLIVLRTAVASDSSCSLCFAQTSLPPGASYSLKWGFACYSGSTYCGIEQKCEPGYTFCNEFTCRLSWPGCSITLPN